VRFDDTNPSKEKDEFEEAIIRDLATLGIKGDQITHSSDHFEKLQQMGEKLIKQGDMYIDDTPIEKVNFLLSAPLRASPLDLISPFRSKAPSLVSSAYPMEPSKHRCYSQERVG